MAAYLSPIFGAGAQLFNNQGIVLAGGKIWTYQAGTTTPLGTWTDSTQVVVNANPIILDSAGRPPNEIWLQAGSQYKFILMDSNNNILGTWDFVSGVNDISTSITVSEWSATGLTPSYISATSFSVTGNNTALFDINRRVKLVVSAGTVYGYVVSSVFGSVTTVVIQPDSTGLDAGLSAVSVGLLDAVNPSVPQQYLAMNAPVNVSSATSPTPIGAALSANVTITGVTPITAFDNVVEGIIRFVVWQAATPITYNVTSMQLIAGQSRTNVAGDVSIFKSLGSGNWKELLYQPMSLQFSQAQGDARYAALAGLATQIFSAANGTTGNQVVNISQFTTSTAAAGYVRVPGGIIIQWGTNTVGGGGSVAVTFPLQFPNACRSITATTNVGNNSTQAMSWSGASVTGFTMWGAAAAPGSWMAIGY